jgi:hypothetical protein
MLIQVLKIYYKQSIEYKHRKSSNNMNRFNSCPVQVSNSKLDLKCILLKILKIYWVIKIRVQIIKKTLELLKKINYYKFLKEKIEDLNIFLNLELFTLISIFGS